MIANSSPYKPFGTYGHSTSRVIAACALGGLLVPPVLAQEGSDSRQVVGLILVPIVALGSAALQPVLAILLPGWTAVVRNAVEQRRGLCLLWGFLLALFVFIIMVLANIVGRWLGAVAALVLVAAGLLSVAGFVGVAASVGSRIVQGDPVADDYTPLQALVGGVILCFASLVPILGQLLGLALIFASLGAAAVSLFARPTPAPRS